MVLPEKLTIRAGFDAKSQLLSVVAQGEHLAVVQEAPEHWGVLMVNNTVGWVPKSAIEMIDYRTEVTFANATAKSETAPPNPSNSVTQGNTIELDPVRKHILEEAFTYLGVPYVWAGNTRRGLDCSAFVKNVFATTGVQLPRHSGDQLRVGVEVQGPDLRPGDRLYFDMKGSGRINHTGIYIGNGMFIHASSNQGKVGVDSLFKKNYYKGLVAARRDFE
jgi:N-acetylmuramoyl-L-alanine amidase